MTQGLTAGGRQRIAAEEIKAASLLEEDVIDEKAREVVLQVIGAIMAGFIGLKREVRKNEASLQSAVAQIVNGHGDT